jgi:hypothetical protein
MAYSKTISYGKNAVGLAIPYGELTIFRFLSPVATISKAKRFEIEPANSEKPDYSVLTVKPRFTKANDSVVFLLGDGSIVKLRLRVLPRNQKMSDGFIDFEPKDETQEPKAFNTSKKVTELDLLRGMIRNRRVSGFKVKKVKKKISGKDGGLNLYLEEVYRGRKLTGYVYKFINDSATETFKIDVRKLKIGKKNLALVSSVERAVLSPKFKETYLWVVAKTDQKNVRMGLPIDVVKAKGGSK